MIYEVWLNDVGWGWKVCVGWEYCLIVFGGLVEVVNDFNSIVNCIRGVFVWLWF